MTAMTADRTLKVSNLRFASSQSKAVGLSGSWMDYIRNNAPRIVGVMKIGGDIATSLTHPIMYGYGLFAIIGRFIMIGYGTKDNQKSAAKEYQQDPSKLDKEGGEVTTLSKILHPKAYPIESSAALSLIAEPFGIAYGISRFFVKKTQEEITKEAKELVEKTPDLPWEEALEQAASSTGFTPIILGVIGVLSYANILFSKEKEEKKPQADKEQGDDGSLRFAESTSKPQGWLAPITKKLKENPVFTSSLINASIATMMMIGGIWERQPIVYIISGAIGLASNLLMAFAVSKQGFNIEGAEEEKKNQQGQSSQPFAEKELTKRAASESRFR